MRKPGLCHQQLGKSQEVVPMAPISVCYRDGIADFYSGDLVDGLSNGVMFSILIHYISGENSIAWMVVKELK